MSRRRTVRRPPRKEAGLLRSLLESAEALVVGAIVILGAIRDEVVVAVGKGIGI